MNNEFLESVGIFGLILFVFSWIMLFVLSLAAIRDLNSIQIQAIERGYAVYKEEKFTWK